jgi:hypothetical protein
MALHLPRRSNLELHCAKPVIAAWKSFGVPPGNSKPFLALGKKYMAHNHGNEYQIRIVHDDGTKELSGLLNSIEQVAQAMTVVDRPQGKTYWLLVRNILCPDCSDKEQIAMECPITNIPSPRFMPHDSGYRSGLKRLLSLRAPTAVNLLPRQRALSPSGSVS